MSDCCVCKILQKIGQLYQLLFLCLKVRLLIFLIQSSQHLLKDRLGWIQSILKVSKENALLTTLLLQWFKVDSWHVLLT